MRIIVYAIAKNEEQFAERWYNTVKEADGVYVLVNNSNDRTAEILSGLGACVKEVGITPFRFDAARNMALELLPDDTGLCVCSDLDDVWPQGWRYKLEQQWHGEESLRYKLLTGNGEVWTDKIHTPKNWVWKHACHEVLEWVGKGQHNKGTTSIQVQHLPDHGKARNYLPLLEMDADENLTDARAWHYLGREYMYHGRYAEAIYCLERSLKYEGWLEQRIASLRFISRCYYRLGSVDLALDRLQLAVSYGISREAYVDMAWFCRYNNDWAGVVYHVDKALKTKGGSYPSEANAWNGYPLKLKEEALAKLRG